MREANSTIASHGSHLNRRTEAWRLWRAETHLGSVDGLGDHQHAGPSRGGGEGGEVGRVVGGRRGRAGRLRSLAGRHLVVEAAHQVVVVQPARPFRACNWDSERGRGDKQLQTRHCRSVWCYQEIGWNPSYSRPLLPLSLPYISIPNPRQAGMMLQLGFSRNILIIFWL